MLIALSTSRSSICGYFTAENIADFQDGGQYADGDNVYITQGSGLHAFNGK